MSTSFHNQTFVTTITRLSRTIQSPFFRFKYAQKKAEPPKRPCPFHRRIGILEIYAFSSEALPLPVPSDFATGSCVPAGDTSVDKVSQYNKRQCQSNHWAPHFQLTSHIDSRITSQVLIFIVTLKVSLAGINVSFSSLVSVIVGSFLCHDITSHVLVDGCLSCSLVASVPR